jgi:uncharacterized membrane protein
VQIVLATVIMGAVLYVAAVASGADQVERLPALSGLVAALIAFGLLLYLGLLQLSGIFRVNDLTSGLRK